MKLSAAHTFNLIEAAFIRPFSVLAEAGEAPRWEFKYDAYKNDPRPNILLLGSYVHPNTGNNLVGGINLNYLSNTQRDDVARALPQIMSAGNLYSRYHKGKSLLPDVFDNFYRTYNAAHIRGVEQGTMFPKFGFKQAAKNLVKKTVGNILKTKKEREAEAQPKFPADLQSMRDKLDQVVTNLNQKALKGQMTGQPEPESPEMQAARANLRKFAVDRARRLANKPEQVQFQQAAQDLQSRQVQTGLVQPGQVPPAAAQQAATTPPPIANPAQMGQAIERERLDNQRELMDPNNDVDLDVGNLMDESITYYSPQLGRYVVEVI